jgi:hypothetical protein
MCRESSPKILKNLVASLASGKLIFLKLDQKICVLFNFFRKYQCTQLPSDNTQFREGPDNDVVRKIVKNYDQQSLGCPVELSEVADEVQRDV